MNAGTVAVYRGESGIWGSNSFLQNIPTRYVDASSASSCNAEGGGGVEDSPTPAPSDDDSDGDDDGPTSTSFINLFLDWLLRLFGLR